MMDDDNLQIFNLTNYRKHPTNEHYVVFFFTIKEAADCFEEFLKEKNIFYERDEETGENLVQPRHLFATKRKDFETVKKLSYTALGLHRKKFINDPIIRWGALVIFLISVGMAIWGFIVTNN